MVMPGLGHLHPSSFLLHPFNPGEVRAYPSRRRMRDANVLVVEDDDTIRRLLVAYLKQHSYVSVEGARDGVEALHLLSTRRYRVLVLDVMMPKMSGVDVLDSVQALLSDPSVKALDAPPAAVVITATAAAA